MAYCPKCGGQVGVRDTYCKGCGERLKQQGSAPIQRRCEFCEGTGKDPGDGNVMRGGCRVCRGGKGKIFSGESHRCRGSCGGTGRIRVHYDIEVVPHFEPCGDCKGWGWVEP